MAPLLIKLVFAPALIVAATLAGRRWGPRLGGVVAAFPAIVGPVLLITAIEHGTRSAARAAAGTLVGLVALAAFTVAYAVVSRRRGWRLGLLAGWLGAAVAQGGIGLAGPRLGWAPAGLIAALSLLTAAAMLAALCPRAELSPIAPPRDPLLLRAAAAALLVVLLSSAVTVLGPTTGGMLAALPILSSLLAVFTDRESGPNAAVQLLRGTLSGMAGFIAFCVLVAAAIVPDGPVPAFALATGAALLLQALVAWRRRPYPAARNSAGRSGDASASARFNPSTSRSAA